MFKVGDRVKIVDGSFASQLVMDGKALQGVVTRTMPGLPYPYRVALDGDNYTFFGERGVLVEEGELQLLSIAKQTVLRPLTGQALVVLNHLKRTSTISVQEAFNDHGLSGGHITKIISQLRSQGYKIDRKFRKHPVTGKRYARYYYFENEQSVKQAA